MTASSSSSDGVHLGGDRYGKSGIRVATVHRDGDRHTFVDLLVEVRLQGDFTAAHVQGDNSAVLPTDTMRGTCYALAAGGIASVAGYATALAERYFEASPAVSRAWVEVTSYPWERLQVEGADHGHAFRPAAGGAAVVTVTADRGAAPVLTGGVVGARVLKTTGSAFSGYLVDEYTTLPPTRDRIMATTVDADWGFVSADAEVDGLNAAVPGIALARFATHDESESVQHTLWEMGRAVLAAFPDVAWIRFRMPNEHHILSDLSPYGLDNDGEVFLVADRPFGVIEGTVVRDGGDGPPESVGSGSPGLVGPVGSDEP